MMEELTISGRSGMQFGGMAKYSSKSAMGQCCTRHYQWQYSNTGICGCARGCSYWLQHLVLDIVSNDELRAKEKPESYGGISLGA